jgi:hypothetical protein
MEGAGSAAVAIRRPVAGSARPTGDSIGCHPFFRHIMEHDDMLKILGWAILIIFIIGLLVVTGILKLIF